MIERRTGEGCGMPAASPPQLQILMVARRDLRALRLIRVRRTGIGCPALSVSFLGVGFYREAL